MDDRKELPTGEETMAGHSPLMSARPASDAPALKQFEDVASVLMIAGGLLERAEEALKRSLETDPRNTATLRKLATVYRSRGNLQESRDAYGRLAELQPDDVKAHFLHAVLSGKEPPAAAVPPAGGWPVPFVRIEGFLATAEHDFLLKTAQEQQDRVEMSWIGDGEGQYNPEKRSSWVLGKKKLDPLIPWFQPRVKEALSEVLPRLQVAPFPVGEVELQMTVHRSGGFYKIHQDSGKEEGHGRRVSYVYYFYRVPKRFTGGDLLLYDTDIEDGTYAAEFSRIETLDNSIVFFPSAYCHQVTTVHCETDDFGDSRFTLNGWFHPSDSRETEGVVAAATVISRDAGGPQRD
jgi:Rps23 Pro-64 3,4-dihydroxylase Tpa1-like proline 4-hydroxylase